MQIVKFHSGKYKGLYAIRKFSLFAKGFYRFLDLKYKLYWWSATSTFFADCVGNFSTAASAYETYEEHLLTYVVDLGTPIDLNIESALNKRKV